VTTGAPVGKTVFGWASAAGRAGALKDFEKLIAVRVNPTAFD
jgi:hypothetical protein